VSSVNRQQRVSDEAYLRLYEEEVAEYAEGEAWWIKYGPLDRGAGFRDDPASIKSDAHRRYAWWMYAQGYPSGLQAMNPDGTWRPWSPNELEA
jgi:hypothetical protein